MGKNLGCVQCAKVPSPSDGGLTFVRIPNLCPLIKNKGEKF